MMTRGSNERLVAQKSAPILATMAGIVCVLVVLAPLHGCGGSTSGNRAGAGGSAGIAGATQGQGGGNGGIGGTVATGGVTSPITGIAGGGGGSTNTTPGTGGILPGVGGATGGKAAGGSGTGVIGKGGTAGTVLVATGGIGTGGIGVGGNTGLGAGGTGGATSRDAGSVDAPPPPCSELTVERDCYFRGDCYMVYKSEQDCGCATAGCCTQFDRCVDGKLADCTGPALCDALTPYCEPPFVLSYRSGCYEGCVRQYDCPVPECPAAAPKDGGYCEPVDHECFYEDCAGAGRTMASCSGGLWKVENGPCTSITCSGQGSAPSEVTCEPGKICVRTTSSGGAYVIRPSCTGHICGSGPVSESCIQRPNTGCFADYSLSGITLNCTESSSGGGGQGGSQSP